MKEILFRGKRLDGKGWITGDLIQGVKGQKGLTWIQAEDYSPAWPYCTREYEIDPETIGMYTGLKGKYNVKIFDDDIVYNGGGDPGVVKWHLGGFLVYFSEEDAWEISQYVHEEYTEVIGNIYDCPNLRDRILGTEVQNGE